LKNTIGIAVISVLLAILSGEFVGKKVEEKIRRSFYALRGDSIPQFIVEYTDSLGVPFVFYAEENGIRPGYQRNATTVATYALQYFDRAQNGSSSQAKKRFVHCAKWLNENITHRKGHGLYVFPWRQPWYPQIDSFFTSGMSSGLALEVFAKAHQLTGDSTYWFAGKQLVRGYYLPIQQGGFTIQNPYGWWYEEFADTSCNTPRVFDGHLFAVLGLHAWIQHDESNDSAAFLLDMGVKAALVNLEKYDAGNGAVFYDASRKLADNKYQQVLAHQLNRMYTISGQSAFKELSLRLNKKLNRPFLLSSFSDGNRTGILTLCMLTVSFFVLLWFARHWLFPKKPQGGKVREAGTVLL
jgi:hypothetical protein